MASRFACAVVITGVLANACLISIYVLLGLHGADVAGGSLFGSAFHAAGSASDLLLPWMSWPQLVVFGVGVLVGLPAYLCIPVWFLIVGRHLGASAG